MTAADNSSDLWQPWPDSALSMARTALSITSQDWSLTGINNNDSSSSSTGSDHPNLNVNNNIHNVVEEVTERMVSLLLIRIVALVTCRLGNLAVMTTTSASEGTQVTTGDNDNNNSNSSSSSQQQTYRRASVDSNTSSNSHHSRNRGVFNTKKIKEKMYDDYSTSTICRSALRNAKKKRKERRQQQRKGEKATASGVSRGNLVDSSSDDDDDDNRGIKTSLSTSLHGGDHDGKEGNATTPATPGTPNHLPMTELRQYSSEPPTYVTGGASNNNNQNTSHQQQHSTSTTTTTTTTALFPKCITPQIISQLRTYVYTICAQYHNPMYVPYHNVEHAYHVFLSANKLLDLMLCEFSLDEVDGGDGDAELLREDSDGDDEGEDKEGPSSSSSNNNNYNNNPPRPKFRRASLDSLRDHRPTFGIKSDPLTQLAFLFSALVHDVDHTGISNRQLVLESDDLAILYNDQSVAEQRSLAVAFSTLKRGEFDELRRVLFENNTDDNNNVGGGGGTMGAGGAKGGGGMTSTTTTGNEDFFKFRKLVIDLVLVTDIASPERTQIVKSKWKEAFGEVIVAEKMKKTNSFRLSGGGLGGRRSRGNNDSGGGESSGESRQVVGRTGERDGGDSSSNNNRSRLPVSRHILESQGRSGSQGSILTAEISLSSNNKADPELKTGGDDDDNDSTDARSIDISESSSISDMQSLDDDFDVSAVSRTKMNFDVNGDSGSLASGKDIPSEQHQQQQQQQRPQQQSNLPLVGKARRRSAGDVALGGVRDLGTEDDLVDQPSPSRGRSTESRATLHARRRSMMTMRGRHTQSMLITSRELAVPRARSEERRLGVRRALDLAGSTIIAYNNNRSSFRSSAGGTSEGPDLGLDLDDDWDEIDEFKATVVLEQMIRAADVAALLQDWNNVMKWSTRLYKELKNGFLSNRGEDPAIGWYDNQIKFFDFYIKPLAKNLGVMGVFDEEVGQSFVHIVKSNLARWIKDGQQATDAMIKQDEKERCTKKVAIDESESSKSSLSKSMGSLSLGNAVAEVKVNTLSTSSTSLLSGTHSASAPTGNTLDESECKSSLRDSFNSDSTASTTNQGSKL